jgi:hypothetical protein
MIFIATQEDAFIDNELIHPSKRPSAPNKTFHKQEFIIIYICYQVAIEHYQELLKQELWYEA